MKGGLHVALLPVDQQYPRSPFFFFVVVVISRVLFSLGYQQNTTIVLCENRYFVDFLLLTATLLVAKLRSRHSNLVGYKATQWGGAVSFGPVISNKKQKTKFK